AHRLQLIHQMEDQPYHLGYALLGENFTDFEHQFVKGETRFGSCRREFDPDKLLHGLSPFNGRLRFVFHPQPTRDSDLFTPKLWDVSNKLETSQSLGVGLQGFDGAQGDADVVVQAESLTPILLPFLGVGEPPQDHASHPRSSTLAPP